MRIGTEERERWTYEHAELTLCDDHIANLCDVQPDTISHLQALLLEYRTDFQLSDTKRTKFLELESLLQQPHTLLVYSDESVDTTQSKAALKKHIEQLKKLLSYFQDQQLFDPIKQHLPTVIKMYQAGLEAPAKLTVPVQLQSPIQGFRYLKPEIAKEFISLFPLKREKMTSDQKLADSGTHVVIKLDGMDYALHCKSCRDFGFGDNWVHPGKDHMVYALQACIFDTPIITPTELVVLKRSEEQSPMLFTLTIPGELFLTAQKNNPNIVKDISHYDLSAHFLLALLAQINDQKLADLFIVKTKEGYRLIGFDYDKAFSETIAKLKVGKSYIELKSCLLFLQGRINEQVRLEFLSKPDFLIVLDLVRMLEDKNRFYHQLAKYIDPTLMANLKIPSELSSDCLQSLFDRIKKAQDFMRKDPKATCEALFEKIYRIEAAYYAYYGAKNPNNIASAYDEAFFGGAYIEAVWDDLSIKADKKEALRESLRWVKHKPTTTTQPVEKVRERFINAMEALVLDCSTLERRTQHRALTALFSNFSQLTSLTLINCQEFDQVFLRNISLTKLSSVTLINCPSVDIHTLCALLVKCPPNRLTITLEGLAAFRVDDLLSLANYCKALYVRLNAEAKYTHRVGDGSRTFLQSLQKEISAEFGATKSSKRSRRSDTPPKGRRPPPRRRARSTRASESNRSSRHSRSSGRGGADENPRLSRKRVSDVGPTCSRLSQRRVSEESSSWSSRGGDSSEGHESRRRISPGSKSRSRESRTPSTSSNSQSPRRRVSGSTGESSREQPPNRTIKRRKRISAKAERFKESDLSGQAHSEPITPVSQPVEVDERECASAPTKLTQSKKPEKKPPSNLPSSQLFPKVPVPDDSTRGHKQRKKSRRRSRSAAPGARGITPKKEDGKHSSKKSTKEKRPRSVSPSYRLFSDTATRRRLDDEGAGPKNTPSSSRLRDKF